MKNLVLKEIKPNQIGFKFTFPPLLVGGMAMMYHELRESVKDVDLIIHPLDYKNLIEFFGKDAIVLKEKHKAGYKDKPLLVNLYGDRGILFHQYEFWKTIMLYEYDDLKDGAHQERDFLVISLEKLLFLCALRGAYVERYLDDAILIGKMIFEKREANLSQ